mmetsp:Transcript_126113/g.315188  ORF Transcript_126113/g.315188 Transcript_126113/m.315188 type:complete len:266 (+) Transcript_126113:865-1662(+)
MRAAGTRVHLGPTHGAVGGNGVQECRQIAHFLDLDALLAHRGTIRHPSQRHLVIEEVIHLAHIEFDGRCSQLHAHLGAGVRISLAERLDGGESFVRGAREEAPIVMGLVGREALPRPEHRVRLTGACLPVCKQHHIRGVDEPRVDSLMHHDPVGVLLRSFRRQDLVRELVLEALVAVLHEDALLGPTIELLFDLFALTVTIFSDGADSAIHRCPDQALVILKRGFHPFVHVKDVVQQLKPIDVSTLVPVHTTEDSSHLLFRPGRV